MGCCVSNTKERINFSAENGENTQRTKETKMESKQPNHVALIKKSATSQPMANIKRIGTNRYKMNYERLITDNIKEKAEIDRTFTQIHFLEVECKHEIKTNNTTKTIYSDKLKEISTERALALFNHHKTSKTSSKENVISLPLKSNESEIENNFENIDKNTNKVNYLPHPLIPTSYKSTVDQIKKLSILEGNNFINSFLPILNKDIQYNSLENLQITSINFCVQNMTDYFKNQKPPLDCTGYFTDPLFPPTFDSIIGKRNGQFVDQDLIRREESLSALEVKEEEVVWLRASEIFLESYSVFTDDIDVDDILQGDIGNCYFLSSLAAMTEQPQLILQLFKNFKISKIGLYEIAVRVNGKWKVVVVDDYFPCHMGTRIPLFARPRGAELWVMLMEKVWAKVNGGYANIVSGSSADVLTAFTSFSMTVLNHQKILAMSGSSNRTISHSRISSLHNGFSSQDQNNTNHVENTNDRKNDNSQQNNTNGGNNINTENNVNQGNNINTGNNLNKENNSKLGNNINGGNNPSKENNQNQENNQMNNNSESNPNPGNKANNQINDNTENNQQTKTTTNTGNNQSMTNINNITQDPIINKSPNANSLWEDILKYDKAGYIMTCDSFDNEIVESHGIIPGHSFTIWEAKEGIINQQRVRLLKLRNPWGYKEWTGDWSDESDKWTDEAFEVLQIKNENEDDGKFWISFEDYLKYFKITQICKIYSPQCCQALKVTNEEAFHPQIFELHLHSNKNRITISVLKKKWRFSRWIKSVNSDDNLQVNLIIAKKVESKIVYIDSINDNEHDPSLEINLSKGVYYIFVYANSEFSTRKKKNYLVYITSDNYFNVLHKKDLCNFTFLRQIMTSKIENDYLKGSSKIMHSGNKFENTTFAYFYLRNKSTDFYEVKWTDQSENFSLVFLASKPQSNNSGKTYLFYMRPDDCLIVIAIRKNYYNKFSFNFKIETKKSTNEEYETIRREILNNERNNSQFLCNINEENNDKIENVENEENKIIKSQDEEMTKIKSDNYSFYYKQIDIDVKQMCENIDFVEMSKNYFLGKYKELQVIIDKVPVKEDGVKVIFRDLLEIDQYSVYLGEWKVKPDLIRHGRGICVWSDGSYYLGQYAEDVNQGFGILRYPNGDYISIDWKQGKMHGKGTYFKSDGVTYPVQYENGFVV